jgi:hypothetical protein
MKLKIFRRAVLVLLGVLLAGCAVTPKPSPAPPASAIPFITPTQLVSPLATVTSGQVVALPTATATPADTPTPLPSPTALIVPITPTPLQVTFTSTRMPTLPPPALVPGATATRVPALPSPTVIARPPSTRAPTPTRAPTVSPIMVTAWVSDPNPEPGVDVQVYGRLLVNGQPAEGEGMVARWHFKGGSFVDCVADTWVDGVAYCTENTYGLPADFTVRIEVFIRYNQVPYRATTELTIR